MNRIFLVLLVCPNFAFSAPIKTKPVYYFPTTVGDTLVYENKMNNATKEHTDSVSSVTEKEGVLIVETTRVVADGKQSTNRWLVSEGSVSRLIKFEKESDTPSYTLKFSVKA